MQSECEMHKHGHHTKKEKSRRRDMAEAEAEKSAPSCCARNAWPWLLAALVVDLGVPSTVGAMCGPHCPPDANFGVVSFLQTVWLRSPYFFGESSLDLWAAAVARCLAYAVLGLLRLRRRPAPSSDAPSTARSTPLLAQSLNSDLASGAVSPALLRASLPTTAVPLMSLRHAALAGWALTTISWVHGTAKGFGRLLQSGEERYGNGSGYGGRCDDCGFCLYAFR